MCGIVGVYSFQENVIRHTAFIKWANTRMKHRGPNSEGFWSDNKGIAFGFRRLSIRDISNEGDQPMLTSDGKHAIVFNGEIYNSDEIKKDLTNSGFTFRSTSDTEVLLKALACWGVESTLKRIDGIFAIAYYNVVNEELYLIRDRAGVKPLYYGLNKKGLVFSSQYDNVINHTYFSGNSIDRIALANYLELGYTPQGQGFINETKLLPQGHFFKITNKGIGYLSCYYTYPILSNIGVPSQNELEEAIALSVQNQLVSDVPLGTFMSGGVDSPLLTYYAKNSVNSIRSYSIGVDDPILDESEAAGQYAAIFKTNHFSKHITEKDLLATIETNMRAFSEPFSDHSSIPTLILSKFVGEHITVALSGDGGDELFWGYPRNSHALQQMANLSSSKFELLFRILKEKFITGKRITSSKWLQIKTFTDYYFPRIFIAGASHWVEALTDVKTIKPNYLYDIEEGLNKDADSYMGLMRKIEFDYHLQRILLKVDRASMYHSLEVRVPFLSNRMLEISANYNYGSCVDEKQGKLALKEILKKRSNSYLPFLPKKGFSIPLGDWLKKELKQDVQERLLNLNLYSLGLLHKKPVELMLKEHFNGEKDWSWIIWSLYSLSYWKEFHVNQWVDNQ